MSYDVLMWLSIGLGASTLLILVISLVLLALTGFAGYLAYRAMTRLDEATSELERVYIDRDNLSYVYESIKDVHILMESMNELNSYQGDPVLENLTIGINSAVKDIESYMEQYDIEHEDYEGRLEYIKKQLESL